MTMTLLADPTQLFMIPTGSLSATDKAALASLQGAVASPRDRPGENPMLFTAQLAGLAAACPPLDPSGCVAGPFGPVYRVSGTGLVASRTAIWLEPNAFFSQRWVFRRSKDSSDPNNDAVIAGIQWLNGAGVPLSQTIAKQIAHATIAAGLQIITARVPSKTGDPAPIVPPKGAAFWRPFIQAFGADGGTDIEALVTTDVTNSGVFAPDVSALAARVSNIESAISDSVPPRTATKSSDYTIAVTDSMILGNALAGPIVLTLPLAASCPGTRIAVKKIDSSTNSVTLKGAGEEMIDAANTLANVIRYSSNTVESDGAQWWII